MAENTNDNYDILNAHMHTILQGNIGMYLFSFFQLFIFRESIMLKHSYRSINNH